MSRSVFATLGLHAGFQFSESRTVRDRPPPGASCSGRFGDGSTDHKAEGRLLRRL